MRKSDAHTPLCTQTRPCVLGSRHSPVFGTVITPCVPPVPQGGQGEEVGRERRGVQREFQTFSSPLQMCGARGREWNLTPEEGI